MKKTTCAGNMSQVVLVFDSAIKRSVLQNLLSQFIKEFPIVYGGIHRDINLCPYWRIPEKAEENLNFTFYNCPNEADLLTLLGKCVNKPFRDNSEHLAFYLINIENRKSCLAMTFDHILFDARGAKNFLRLFQQYLENGKGPEISSGIPLTAPAYLSEWKKKFLAGRNVNRKIVTLSKTPPETLPIPSDKNKGFKFKLISFNQQETQTIQDSAYREAGYLMETPYLLAAVMQAMHELFRKRGLAADNFLSSVNIDMRTSENINQELFFNHVSYLFYQVPSDIMDNPKEIMTSITMQMYEQVKAGIPRDIMEASHLTRIMPRSFIKKIIDVPLKGKIATFIFSHVNKNPLSPEIIGVKIENVFHMPRVPMPPGLGFFSNYFNGRLNVVISHLDGLISDEEALTLENSLKEKLLGENLI